MYLKQSSARFLILILYLDDFLRVSNNKEMIEATESWLESHFDIKEVGNAVCVLKVKIQPKSAQINH